MSNEIDWAKPLECDKNHVTLIAFDGHKAHVDIAECMSYWVHMDTGTYVGAVLDDSFTVRNVISNRDKAMAIADDTSELANVRSLRCGLVKELANAGLLIKD